MSGAVKAVTNVVKSVVKAVVNVVKAVVNVVADVISFVAQPFMGLLGGMPDIPSAQAEAERQQGVLVQRTGSVVNIPVVYGYRKVGGAVTFAETGSTNNQYLWVAYVFSEGPCEGLREIFIDDNQLPETIVASLNAGQTVDITTGKYANRVKLQFYHGAYYSNPSSSPIGTSSICKDAPSWKSSMTYNGLCVLFARFEWKEVKTQEDADNNPFGGNIPELQVTLLGRKVSSLTITDPSSQSYGTGERYSTNPAEILLDYMRNPRYGKGLTNADIDWTSWKKAAQKCNQTVTYVTSGIQGPILTCNYVLDTGQSIFANTKNLLMGFRAYMPYVQGKYKLKIEDAGNDDDILSGVATIVLTAVADPYAKDQYTGNVADIVGDITYTGIERSSKYNQVSITYVDPDKKWANEQVVFPEDEASRQVYIAEDGGRENKLDATFPTLTNYAIAKDMARLLFNKSRFQETCSLTITAEGLELEPGDNIRIQARKLNFGTTPWRVVSIKYNSNMTVDLGCVRNPDNIYPHARFNEEDIVVPVYVPKGSTIYYPSVIQSVPVGLVPPKNGVIPVPPEEIEDPIVTPPPTDPGNPEDPTDETPGGGNPDTPPINTPPPAPPVEPQPLDAVIDVTNVSYTYEDGVYYATLEFKQPVANYAGLVLYYKRNISTEQYYRSQDDSTVPGLNNTARVRLGPITNSPYQVVATVKYSTGERSTKSVRFYIQPTGGAANPSETITETGSLDIRVVEPGEFRRDTNITVVAFQPVTEEVSGQPGVYKPVDPRQAYITVKQELSEPENWDIVGMKIYYKPSSDTYWYEKDITFDSSYFPGKQTQQPGNVYGHRFLFDGEGLGNIDWPYTDNSPGVIGAGTTDDFDFIFQWKFSDGTTGTRQTRYTRVNVETDLFGEFGTPASPRNIWYGVSGVKEDKGSFNFTTRDMAPPGAIAEAINTKFGLVQWNRGGRSGDVGAFTWSISGTFYMPDASNRSTWRGARIYWRSYQPGSNPEAVSWTSRKVTESTSYYPAGQINYRPDFQIPDNQLFEIVVVPLVYSGGNIVESNYSVYGFGKLFSDTSNGTWTSQQIKTESLETWKALGQIKTSIPALSDTVVQITDALLYIPYYNNYNGVPKGTKVFDYAYQSLTFDHRAITNNNALDYKGIRVYTRHFYNGVDYTGPWEYRDFIQSNTGGTITVKFRLPVSNSYFLSSYYKTQIKPPPYTLVGGSLGFQYNPTIDVIVRVIKADDTLSDKVLYYRYPAVTGVPPAILQNRVPAAQIKTENADIYSQYADVIFGGNIIQQQSRLNLSNAISAIPDVGETAATNQFVSADGATKNYVKRWS